MLTEIIVDIDTKEAMKAYSWYITDNGYVRSDYGKRSIMLLHQFVMNGNIPPIKNLVPIDHKNRNKLDNRRENLRWTTARQNALNTNLIVKGYYFRESRNTWVVCYKINGKRVYFGSYSSEATAASRAQTVREQLLKDEGL